MTQTKSLLAETDMSLSGIALQVGCADPRHFTPLFRVHVAQTPTAYRTQTRHECLLVRRRRQCPLAQLIGGHQGFRWELFAVRQTPLRTIVAGFQQP